MNSQELIHYLNKNELSRLYLFAGPEIGEKNEMLAKIQQILEKNGEIEKSTFYCGENLDLGLFSDTLKTGQLFSAGKLILLKNIEQANQRVIQSIEEMVLPPIISSRLFKSDIEKALVRPDQSATWKKYYQFDQSLDAWSRPVDKKQLKGEGRKKLLSLFQAIGFSAIPSDTVLIMLNETGERIPSALTSLLSQKQHIMFWEMFENRKLLWIRNQFKEHNCFIDDDAAGFILDMVENNTDALGTEIQKIILLSQKTGTDQDNVISKEFIEDYLFHSKEESVFTLYNTMLSKNLPKSLEILEKLFYSDEEAILPGLLWSHRRFLTALDMKENQRMDYNRVFATLKISGKKSREIMEQGMSNYPLKHIAALFDALSELDYRIKLLPSPLKLVKLQQFILSFIGGDDDKSFLQGPLQYLQQ
jgi:DNA polymerase-3 subunit delta